MSTVYKSMTPSTSQISGIPTVPEIPKPQTRIPKLASFFFGGIAGMAATCFVQPTDVLKNRMQMTGELGVKSIYKNTLHAGVKISRSEGVSALWSGLSAGLMRQATYTTGRMGVYTSLFDHFTSADGTPPNIFMKCFIGAVAGSIGAIFGTPADVVLVRMCLDGRNPLKEKRGYKNVFHGFHQISKYEGASTLLTGWRPTVVRAMFSNSSQLASYSQAKQLLIHHNYMSDNVYCHVVSSVFAGGMATIATMPVDLCKTRIQNQKILDGHSTYTSAADVFVKTIKTEGFFSLWKGSLAYFARVGPHTILLFVFLEKFKSYYLKYRKD
ncbi:Mitochondrial 2-oxoglutarate/malate carrier protein-like [Oopsacas minuta]|uniref:Mitochondrial 2-oxoglutarate/malate carrier protein-like n=1 Tax=Oopsacas minuta TaxID=111878 RepID=A0AAV7K9B1_9METZ|nr:Mitochondrial 2-oxoglutarate/malate carrier protein-like [Oopsacas minuta]